MAVSEDRTSCWVHKDLTVTTKQSRALWTAARASGRKDERQARLTGIRSARRTHFTRSNRRAPKKNNRRSSDTSGPSESASRRTSNEEAEIQADKDFST